uniref:Uncharacterized protein n=1 Tax=Lotharella oceanica TaxID=641309 RepID=A0A7S2TMF3_9EUKA|mmetsp:Transcript_19384/g.36497  ORF Transcript_19384/g.36497 Transcript_19384/m.36497 type:complete len:423 (+) Transcript_19384:24-1292(+)
MDDDDEFSEEESQLSVRISRPSSIERLLPSLHEELQELCLHHAGLDGKSMAPLVQALGSKPRLVKLSLAFNRLQDAGVATLCPLLPKSHIRYLNLARNHITAEGCKALATGLCEAPELKHLDLSENLCKDEGIIAIAAALRNKALCSLILSKNRMGRAGLAAVAGLVRDSKTIEKVGLYLNGIDHQGAIMLSDALMVNKSVVELDLGANPLGSNGIFSLAVMLDRNTNLRSLDVRGCEVGYATPVTMKANNTTPPATLNRDGETVANVSVEATDRTRDQKLAKRANGVGISKLCTQMSGTNYFLQNLLLSFNQLGDREVELLCHAVAKNRVIKWIAMVNCGISAKAMSYVAYMVKENKSLTRLDLGLNTIPAKAAKALGASLRANSSLTALDLTQCRLGGGVSFVAESLPQNNTLRSKATTA